MVSLYIIQERLDELSRNVQNGKQEALASFIQGVQYNFPCDEYSTIFICNTYGTIFIRDAYGTRFRTLINQG